MPNRIIKESICTSDSIDALTPEEEVFFIRLMVNCDDYGRMDARPDIVRAKCFPLKLEKVKGKDIEKWLKSLQKELIKIYVVNGRPYLQLVTWDNHQQVRAKKSKFPSPDSEGAQLLEVDNICNQMISNDDICPRNPIQSLSLSESESIYSTVVDAYHHYCHSLPKVRDITDKRKTAIKKLLSKYSQQDIDDVFWKAEQSDFLSGRNGKWTSCNFDWLIDPKNFVKALEGTYSNKDVESPVLAGIRRFMENADE